MDTLFALCLTEHHRWGYLLTPMMLGSLPGKDYLSVREYVTVEYLNRNEGRLTETEEKIARLLNQCSEKEMVRVMRRNTSVLEFLRMVTDEMVEREIRPYIERYLLHCINLLPGSGIPLFRMDNAERVYIKNEIRYGDEPAEAVFNFHYRPDEGLRYFLSVYFQGKEISVLGKHFIPLVSNPLVIALDDNLLQFKDIDVKKLTPFVNREYITVPKQMTEEYFRTFVLKNIRKFRTHAEGFEVVDETSTPVAVISLENDLQYRPMLLLKFDYGNGRKPVHAAAPSETDASLEIIDGKYTVKRFRRNGEAERVCIEILCELGFYNAGNSMFYTDELSAHTDTADTGQCLANLVEKLNTLSETLAAKGFRIDQRFFSQKYFTGSIKLDVELKTERDWFDLHAVVHFGGFDIPFINFRDHIIRQDRNYVLPNGELLILPAEWFAKYSQAMLMGEESNGNLRLDKRYFTIVDDAFEGMDKKYLRSMMALCHVDEMEPDDKPENIRATLRPYQLQGVTWLRVLHDHRLGGCLADDMGLGKTLQAITLLQSVLDDCEGGTSLIVMPSSLIHNWVNEINRFAPHLKVLKYVGSDRQNDTDFGEYHIVLTTYGILRNDSAILSSHRFLYAILDEAQYIRNPESVTFHAAMLIEANHCLTLSGTPVENRLTDLWAQMNFLNRGLLGELNFFRTHFAVPIEKYNDQTARTHLQRLIQPFLLRRTKREVTPELPELTESVRYCEMTDRQRILYEEEKSKARNAIIESIEEQGVEKSGIMILQALSRLRQLAIHPAMLDPGYDADSGKFDQIIESMESLRSEGHKALLFSSFTKHLDLIAAHLKREEIPYSMLTGKTRNREEEIDRFNSQPDIPFFLISLKAGGVGLNLTSAGYLFLLDPWWNPAAEQQAISRTHRIGQTEKVFAYRMITSDTVEEKILQLQEKKSALADILAQSGNPFREMDAEDIVELFR